MSERIKSRIVQVGKRKADGEFVGWIFAGGSSGIEYISPTEIYYGGYSAEELIAIMAAKDEEELQLAKNIGEQMSGKILCPRKCVEGQELSTYGDNEDSLFCPHCELDIEIVVRYR